MEKVATEVEGLVLLRPKLFLDRRGSFVKTYNQNVYASMGLKFVPKEEFFSTSRRNVIRGMHLQIPPAHHTKVVYCLTGAILDVAVDLRTKSKTYGKYWTRELNDVSREIAVIPPGCAHGFLSLTDNVLTVYLVGAEHDPANDVGVRWDSIGFDWPCSDPIISDRDAALPPLSKFVSPF